MALQFIGIDPGTDGNDCPYGLGRCMTGDSVVLKGWKITDPVMLAATAPDHREVVMRFPARMAQFVQEAAGASRGPAVSGADRGDERIGCAPGDARRVRPG